MYFYLFINQSNYNLSILLKILFEQMLLYDLPLIKETLSKKCIGGLFTKTRNIQPTQSKNDQWLSRSNCEIIICKTSCFELYKLKKSPKSDKIDMSFMVSTQLYVQICAIEICTTRLSQSRQYIDLVILTTTSNQLLIYMYTKSAKKFMLIFKELIFKTKSQPLHPNNVRLVGNYITCSEQNHFIISSIRGYKKIYSISLSQGQDKQIKSVVKTMDTCVKENFITWDVTWLPSMVTELDYLGKYVAIQREVLTLHHRQSHKMVEQKDQQSQKPRKKLVYYYVDKYFKIQQRQQKKQGFTELKQSCHMLIPISSCSFFILYQNRMYLRQLSSEIREQRRENREQRREQSIIDLKLPIREPLVDKNIQTLFSCYSKQPSESSKQKLYLMNEFGDLFQIEYVLNNILIANFTVRYVNSLKTTHSIIAIGQIQMNKIKLHQEEISVRHQNGIMMLFGLERYGVGLYFLIPPKNVDTKPKEIKVAIRALARAKANKTFPDYSDPQCYKPIVQRSRDFELSDQIQHMGAIVDIKIASLRSNKNDENNKQLNKQQNKQQNKEQNKQQNFQIFALTNGGNLRHEQHIDQTIQQIQSYKSYLKIIKKGLKIRELSGYTYQRPMQMFSLKKSQKQPYHKIIILCLASKTTCLTITPQSTTLTYYKEINFEQSVTTLYVGKFQDQSFVQIYGSKVRHIRKERGAVKEYNMKNKVVIALAIGRQMVLALFGGEILYFELDKDKEQIEQKKDFYVDDEVLALEFTPIQSWKGTDNLQKRMARYVVMALKNNHIVIYRIVKKQKQPTLQVVFTQNLKSQISSVCMAIVSPQDLSTVSERTYCLYVGMHSGSMLRIEFDHKMLKMGQKSLLISSKPLRLKRTSLGSKREDSILILSQPHSYLYYIHKMKYTLSLLAYNNIDLGVQMKQSENPNLMMVYSQGFLRFLTVQTFGEDFHDQRVDLFFSGKKLLVFQNCVGIIQADPSYEKQQKTHSQTDIDVQTNVIQVQNLEKIWKSQFTIYKVKDSKKVAAIYFDQTKQICLCAAYNSIKAGLNKGGYLIFGCAQGITYYPKFQTKNQTIKVYSWASIDNKNEFLYSLNIDSVPLVIEPFSKGQKFLAGIGNSLRLFQITKKKLLMKAQVRNLPSNVNQIKTVGKKIFVTGVSQSFHLFKYIPEEHTFYDIAEDALPKFITTMNVLDSETVCAADKFGNLLIGRLTQSAKTAFQATFSSSNAFNSQILHKFTILASINVGQIVTSINKAYLYNSKVQVILYSTIMGQVRCLYPLTQYQQVKALPAIQQALRYKFNINDQDKGRRKVISGEVVQRFLYLSQGEQLEVIRKIGCTENDLAYVKELIEQIRQRIL